MEAWQDTVDDQDRFGSGYLRTGYECVSTWTETIFTGPCHYMASGQSDSVTIRRKYTLAGLVIEYNHGPSPR